MQHLRKKWRSQRKLLSPVLVFCSHFKKIITKFRTWSGLVVSDELQEKLQQSDSHLTVLAFTDDAFAKLPERQQVLVRSKQRCMQGRCHCAALCKRQLFSWNGLDLISELILPHTICSAAVFGEAKVRNLKGHLLNASLSAKDGTNVVSFQGVPVSMPDRVATNGVIHVTDGVVFLDHSKSKLHWNWSPMVCCSITN